MRGIRLSRPRFQTDGTREQSHTQVQEVEQQMPQQRPSQWGVNWGSAQYETFYTSLMQTALLRKQDISKPKARIDDDCGADDSTHEPKLPWDDISSEPPSKKQRTSDDCGADESTHEPTLPWDDIFWEPPTKKQRTSDDVAVKQEDPTNVARGGRFFVFSQARGKS